MAQKYSVGDVEFGAEAGFLAAGDQSILFLADGKKCRAVYDGTINEVRHKLAAMGWVPVVRTERVARFRAPTTEEVAERERAEEPRLSAKAIMATVRNLVGLSTPEPREGKGPSAQCNKRREARAALVAERMPLDSPHVAEAWAAYKRTRAHDVRLRAWLDALKAASNGNCPRCSGTGFIPRFAHKRGGRCFRWSARRT